MQLIDQDNIEKRILHYISKMYSRNLKKSQDYSELNKCIGIVFIDFELENLKNVPKYITKWNLREKDYVHIILTDVIELYIIEMPKIERYAKKSNLDIWVKFIIDVEDARMEDIEEIKKAKEVLEQISEDEHERYLADLREKYIMDMNNIESTGFRKGKEEGLQQGIQKGETKMKIEMAKKMKNKNIDIDSIIEITGLTKEEIKKL